MAKAKSEPHRDATQEELAIARRAIQDVTGCGELESTTRATELGNAKVVQIAALEREGKRTSIVEILYS